jgi:undecaprenyl-diphosphatase
MISGWLSVQIWSCLVGPAAVAFAVLSVYVAHRRGPTEIDKLLQPNVVDHVYHWQLVAAQRFLDYGVPVSVTAITAAVAAWCWRLEQRRSAAIVVACPSVSVALTEILKHIIDRKEGAALGFPSGHASGASALAVVLALLLGSLQLSRTARVLMWLVVASLGIGVSLVIVLFQYHYATDVIGSWLLAIVVVLTVAFVFDRTLRRDVRQGGPA